MAEVAAREGAALAVTERRTHAVAYAKGHDAIADVLALAGAGDTALRLEEHAVVAAIRADANRLANADEANLVRATRAAHEQLEAIRAIGVDALPPQLAEIAELRMRNPSASLRELAAKARPPITKASAHRRLRAIQRLVES
jgi:cell division protein WhiA